MIKVGLLGLVIFPLCGVAQSIRNTNFKYWYDLENPVDMKLNLVRKDSSMEVQYDLVSRNSNLSTYQLNWEKRKSFGQERGEELTPKDSILSSSSSSRRGLFTVPVDAQPWVLVCKVSDPSSSFSWIYYKIIEKNFPTIGYITKKNARFEMNYATEGDTAQIAAPRFPVVCTYYKQAGNPPPPPYSTEAVTADNFRKYDSVFVISTPNFQFKKQGLYLFQNDTTAAEGFSICVMPKEFPKFGNIEDLSRPVVYLTTSDEFAVLKEVGNDKAKFDKLILSITGDKAKAKNFMRSYYHRVTAANLLFTSYKQGWETDQGLIYLIFGVPDDVRITSAGEVWNYTALKTKFVFAKSGSVYDPDYMSLVRSPQLKDTWLGTVDMWRKSRF